MHRCPCGSFSTAKFLSSAGICVLALHTSAYPHLLFAIGVNDLDSMCSTPDQRGRGQERAKLSRKMARVWH